MNNNNIILIGPMCAGKSTIAFELSKKMQLPQIPMDRLRWYYYAKDGFDFVKEQELETFSEKIKYWKPFEAKAVKRIVEEFSNSIIDFGAGHSYFESESDLEYARQALAPLKNVILLLPSENKEESFEVCQKRLVERWEGEPETSRTEANRDFIFGKSNYALAKHIVYTKGKTPSQTAEEIEALVKAT